MSRRWSHQAGNSWRKWGDPLMYGAAGREVDAEQEARDGRVFLFWLLCLDLGALVAVLVAR